MAGSLAVILCFPQVPVEATLRRELEGNEIKPYFNDQLMQFDTTRTLEEEELDNYNSLMEDCGYTPEKARLVMALYEAVDDFLPPGVENDCLNDRLIAQTENGSLFENIVFELLQPQTKLRDGDRFYFLANKMVLMTPTGRQGLLRDSIGQALLADLLTGR